jgi:hypothetical protein
VDDAGGLRVDRDVAKIRAMLRLASVGLAIGFAACAGDEPKERSENRLVLEIGNEAGSLRDGLALARERDPKQAPAPVPDPAAAKPTPTPAPTPTPTPARTVTLRPQQTLIQVATEHLGDGARYTEILALNGWTEADARRLPPGTSVKLPAR